MLQVKEKYECRHPVEEWKYDLRIRYYPKDFAILATEDAFSFDFLYRQVHIGLYIEKLPNFYYLTNFLLCYMYFLLHQVQMDYLLSDGPWDQELAVHLAGFQLHKIFCTQMGTEKKQGLENLDREGELEKYFPPSVILNAKRKALKRAIQHRFKKNAHMSERECILKFLSGVMSSWDFTVEKFSCELSVSAMFLFFILMLMFDETLILEFVFHLSD